MMLLLILLPISISFLSTNQNYLKPFPNHILISINLKIDYFYQLDYLKIVMHFSLFSSIPTEYFFFESAYNSSIITDFPWENNLPGFFSSGFSAFGYI